MTEKLENIEIGFKAGLVDAMRDPRDMWKPIYYFKQMADIIDDLRDQIQELENKIDNVKEVEEINEEES